MHNETMMLVIQANIKPIRLTLIKNLCANHMRCVLFPRRHIRNA
jgi:hypothetical protein